MISPSEYDRLCDQLMTLYGDLEDAIISDIVRRILKTGRITESAKWQIKQLQESGLLYDDILAEIASRTDATSQHVKALFEDAGVQSIRNDNRYYRAAGLAGIVKMSDAALQTLNAGYLKCGGDLKNLTMTTAFTSQQAYITACNNAYMQVTSGAFDYNTAIRNAIKSAAVEGTHVLYPSGHKDRIDVAVRRAVLTGVGQTVRKLSVINAEDMGCDIMEITAHSGARPSHAAWQGKLVSLSGKNAGKIIEGCRVLSLSEIGYGSGDGFGGWNCRHDWYPFLEGISKRTYSDERLKELDAKDIEYNGKKYSEYEISQIQRRYEREIRSAKREQVAFKTAVQEAQDPELKQVMQDSLNYANSVVKDKQAKMRDFINQTGQYRDYLREQNYGRVSKNFRKAVDNSESYGIIRSNKGFVLAENVTKAEEYARNVLGIKNVFYKGLDTFTANELNNVLEEHFKEFPELKKQINFVGTCQERNRLIKEKIKAYYKAEYEKEYSYLSGELLNSIVEVSADEKTKDFMQDFKVYTETYAQSFWRKTKINLSEFYGISVNEDFGSNHAKFIESIKNDEKIGHLPVGCNTIKSILDHEIGHQLDSLLDLKYNPLIRSVFDEFEKNPNEIKEKLSGYALQGFLNISYDYKYSEPIAEAWSEYCNNFAPREIAEKIGKIIKRLYDEKF
ncbi:MAG: phage minor capsid protein [Ruminococcus sp.]|nr:phage minor capsid protein [Ruminococcus sp.]